MVSENKHNAEVVPFCCGYVCVYKTCIHFNFHVQLLLTKGAWEQSPFTD